MRILKVGKKPEVVNDKVELYFTCRVCKTEFVCFNNEYSRAERHPGGNVWYRCPYCNEEINHREVRMKTIPRKERSLGNE